MQNLLFNKCLALLVAIVAILSTCSTLANISFSQQTLTPKTDISLANETASGSMLYKVPGSASIVQLALDTKVEMDITGTINRVSVEQTFTNPSNDWVEGIYVFPLPEDSAVDHLTMRIGERIIEGLIKEKEEAKKIYNQAKSEGKSASLVEQQRPNIFTNSVANIPPGETIVITIEYHQSVLIDNDIFSIRFPMVIGERFIPGVEIYTSPYALGMAPNTHEVPDASKITPPNHQRAFLPVTMKINLKAGFDTESVNSTYHPILVTEVDELTKQIRFNENHPIVQADRDFELTWKANKSLQPELALFTQKMDDDYYLMLMATPPKDEFFADNNTPRELIFIIDSSGSMHGMSMRQAKEALVLALSRLRPTDRFNIIDFDDRTRPLFESAIPAIDRSKNYAYDFIRGLDADGGTQALDAVKYALGSRDSKSEQYLRQIVFLTDGQVGNETRIFKTVERKIGTDRFFSVGIGSAPNSFLMTKLADFGRGAYTYIGKISEVKQKMLELLYKLESPAMTNIRIDFPSGSESEQGFGAITDLYAGETISAIFKTKSLPSTLRIEGDTVNGKFTKDIDITPANESKGLDVLWARRKIESLTDLYYFDRSSAQQKAIRKDITSIALKHHLVSKFTSLVAVDVTPTRPEEEIIVTQPIINKIKASIESELAELRVAAIIQPNRSASSMALNKELAAFEAQLEAELAASAAYTAAYQANAATNTWKCNAGYIKSGNSCKKIIGQINTQLASSVNASRTATNSELLIYLGLVIMLLAAILRRRQNA